MPFFSFEMQKIEVRIILSFFLKFCEIHELIFR